MMRRIKLNKDRTLDILHPKKKYILADFAMFNHLKVLTQTDKHEYVFGDDKSTGIIIPRKTSQTCARSLMECIENYPDAALIEVDSLDEINRLTKIEICQFIKDTGGNVHEI